jgi:hypothetical protein
MNLRRSATHSRCHSIPRLRFEDQTLTSFAGLVIVQRLFDHVRLKERLRDCFSHLSTRSVYGLARVTLHLIVHLLLGYRELRDSRYYDQDPMVLRLLGLKRLPDVSTVSRTLAKAAPDCVERLRRLLRNLVLDRLTAWQPPRLTLDFDGSVNSTRRHAEGTAVGFNKMRKGARSYYPLFCTIAQTGQVFDFLHRPGNVHDSNGAVLFILDCIGQIQRLLPGTQIEVRLDAAFFSDAIVSALDAAGVHFSISVPFERFPQLKALIQSRRRWRRTSSELSYFHAPWKPKVWPTSYRFLCLRRRVKIARKEPLQYDCFVPHETGFEFKVIVTNHTLKARHLVAFHEGRGSQEGLFAELKSQAHAGYIGMRRLIPNQIYLACAALAHNLCRELQMIVREPRPRNGAKRPPMWVFEEQRTLCRTFIQRAGRLVRPQGALTLIMNGNRHVESGIRSYLEGIDTAA